MRVIAWIMLFIFAASPLAEAGVLQRKVVIPVEKPSTNNASQSQAIARQDYNFPAEKYAALVMDAKTGEVLHARNADAQRYPASLTKMMTLYLLFEALEQKKITTKSAFVVSRLAAQQPQTNISLIPGERIPVDTAIRALIIRSANDVAVVVAENLGKSVSNFALMMTQKARALGMRNTVFKNPNGLPDSNQHTTARDLAKLAIALRRDFPEYYPYFSVRQFTWKRVSYYTHNRVMLRYSGVDGLKTGFINASGFNVVTSLKRNGRTLIGVVMGGNNATARDDRMIALLEQTQQALNARGNTIANMQPQNLPAPKVSGANPTASVTVQSQNQAPAQTSTPLSTDRGIIKQNITDTNSGSPQQTRIVEPDLSSKPSQVVPVITTRTITVTPQIGANINTNTTQQTFTVASANLPTTTAAIKVAPFATTKSSTLPLSRAMNDVNVNSWGIQVGAYEDRTQAEQAVRKAISIASNALQGSRSAVMGAGTAYKTIHRARLENLTEDQARKACQALISNQSPCFIYRVN